MIEKYDMEIVNEEQQRCKGLWTREQGKDKSVIDYVITDKKRILQPCMFYNKCALTKIKNICNI